MKKSGLIALLALVVGAGSLVWAEKGIKITEKSGRTTFVVNGGVDHVQFLEDHNGTEIGVKVVNGSQETFFPAANVESIEYVTDYVLEPQEEAGTLSEVKDGFEVAYSGNVEVSPTAGNITVKPVSGGGGSVTGKKPTVNVSENKLSIVLEGYNPAPYTVTVPKGYLNIGINYSGAIEQTVVVDKWEVEGTVRTYTNGMQVSFNETLARGVGEVTVTGTGSEGKTPEVTLSDTKIAVSLVGYPDGTYTVTIPKGYVYMGKFNQNKEVVEEITVATVASSTKKTKDREDGNEVKMVVCFETNDVNPVNATRYVLKNQNKALWDYVVLFSGNIDYNNAERPSFFNPNDDQRRPYFYANPGIQYILEHQDEIIKPLKDMGIKVIMGILPNHDGAGLLNLNDEGIESLVDDLYNLQQNYGIDGFFWDEEYADYQLNITGPGISSSRSTRNFVNILKAVKENMPTAENLVFAYNELANLGSAGEQNLSQYIDGILPNYGAYYTESTYPNYFPGTTKNQWGYASREASTGSSNWASESSVLTPGYCFQMIFAPGRPGYESDMDEGCLGLARTYYEDELNEAMCPGDGSNWVEKQW